MPKAQMRHWIQLFWCVLTINIVINAVAWIESIEAAQRIARAQSVENTPVDRTLCMTAVIQQHLPTQERATFCSLFATAVNASVGTPSIDKKSSSNKGALFFQIHSNTAKCLLLPDCQSRWRTSWAQAFDQNFLRIYLKMSLLALPPPSFFTI